MLSEAKRALRVTADAYDAEIASLLQAGAADLELSGVILPGTVDITVTESGGTVTSTDSSTLDDPLVMRAVFTYAAANFGNPPNADRLKASYDEQKRQLMHANAYTDFSGGDCG